MSNNFGIKTYYNGMTKEELTKSVEAIAMYASHIHQCHSYFEQYKRRDVTKASVFNDIVNTFKEYAKVICSGEVPGLPKRTEEDNAKIRDAMLKDLEAHKGDKNWLKDFLSNRIKECDELFSRWACIMRSYKEQMEDGETPVVETPAPEPTPEPEQEPTQDPVQEFINRITTDEYANETLKSLKRGVVPWLYHAGETPEKLIDFMLLLTKVGESADLEKQASEALEKNNCLLTPRRKNCAIEIASAMLMSLNGIQYSIRNEKEAAAWYLETGTEGDKRHKVKGFALRRILRHVAKAMEVVVEKARKAEAEAAKTITLPEPKVETKPATVRDALKHEANERYGEDWVKQHVVFG